MPKAVQKRKSSAAPTTSKKRGRPPNVTPPYPPPPPPPPPPANNPYYQKFFADYWAKHNQGYQVSGPPPPLPPNAAGAVPYLPPPPAIPPMVAPPPAPDAPTPRIDIPQEEYPCDKTDRVTYVLATPGDPDQLSDKQCYVRTRLCEIFLSQQTDVEKSVRGRKAAFVGQVGLRCVFCVPAMDSKDRVERALCYPTKIAKFYQTVQDMQHFHFNTCPAIPLHMKELYLNFKGNMNNKRGENKISPKEYWMKCCEEVGLVDHIGNDGTNAGVKLKEGHSLVLRSRLPEYAKELFMPPKPQKEGKDDKDDENGEFAQLLEDGEGKVGNDEDVAFNLSDDAGDQEKGAGESDDQKDGLGETEEQDDRASEMEEQDDGVGEMEEQDDGDGEMEDLEDVQVEVDDEDSDGESC